MRFISLLVLSTVIACSSDKLDMTGSYKLISRHVKSRDADSTSTGEQLKIYSGDYVMFARFGPDSMPAWGVRKVLPVEGGVRESNVYAARGDTEIATPHIYTLIVERAGDGFRQVIPDMEYRGQHLELTEEYERVDRGIPTPYDGAWELTEAFIVRGTDTTRLDIVQYKFYHSGNFIFGHSLRDSLKNPSAGFGYGTYDVSGDDTLTEHVQSSNYSQIVGKSFNIKVRLEGNDKLFQVVDELEGAKSVESYRRL